MFDKLEDLIVNYPPQKRRRMAIQMLFWSVMLMFLNVGAYLLGWIDETDLILITLVLSWLALTITAADLVATTDVREATDE